MNPEYFRKNTRTLLSPLEGKRMVIFIDDVNMP